jgi:hypothetical protein
LLFEASSIALASGIAFVIKTYIFDEKEINIMTDLFSSVIFNKNQKINLNLLNNLFFLKLIANSITYPLSVVSTVSGISGSQLVAAKPPKMALYTSWIEVFKHLQENVFFLFLIILIRKFKKKFIFYFQNLKNELKRGASQFFRVYTPRPNIPLSGFVLNRKAF